MNSLVPSNQMPAEELRSPAATTRGPSAIEVQHLTKRYSSRTGAIEAVSDLSFEVEDASLCSLIGPSGCGKSTALQIIAGLLPHEGGSVQVFGEPARSGRRDVGIMFQAPVLFPWRTVIKNVLLPFEVYRESIDSAREKAMTILEMVGLEGFADKYPWELSGGMQQRAALSRTLVTDPRLLLMDEPLAALDEFTRERLVFEIASIQERLKRAALYVTHDIREALILSDRVVVMTSRPGRLLGIVDVDLPRPRVPEMMETPEFSTKVSEIRSLLRGEI